MSPVRRTCVPPHSSIDHDLLAFFACPPPAGLSPMPIDTTRTSSPYFSPNRAMAPVSMASSMAISRVSTGAFCRMMAFAMSSTAATSSALIGLVCEKSKRSRSGATSEPFCATWVPSTWRSASCSRCVAEWLARVAERRAWSTTSSTASPGLNAPFSTRADVHDQVAQLLLRIADPEQRALRPLDEPRVADLSAGLAIEGRLVEHQRALLAGSSGPWPACRP